MFLKFVTQLYVDLEAIFGLATDDCQLFNVPPAITQQPEFPVR